MALPIARLSRTLANHSQLQDPFPMHARVAEAPVSATLNSWRRERGGPSLSEVHRSIAVAAQGTPWRKFTAFLGPGYLVAVGYMDPGNWATALAGGSKFGYALL